MFSKPLLPFEAVCDFFSLPFAGRGARLLTAFITFVVLAIVTTTLASPTVAQANSNKSELILAYCQDCVPFQFKNVTGAPDGMIIDYWKLWSKKTGVNVVFKSYSWAQSLNQLRDGAVDAHAGMFFSENRAKLFDYGEAMTRTDTNVFFHNDIKIPKTLGELKAFRIGVLANDLVQSWLEQRLGKETVIPFANYETMLEALKRGEVKVFAADTLTALFHLKSAGLLAKFKYEKVAPLYRSLWHVAARKNAADILKLVNQGMMMINSEERLRISRTWASGQRSEGSDNIIIAIDNYYPPLTALSIDGKPHGLLIDIWREWGRAVGRTIVFKSGTWKQTLNWVRTGEADIHSGLFKSEKRAKYLAFSMPLQSVKTGLYTKSDSDIAASLSALQGKRLGVVAGTYQAQFLEENYPQIKTHKVIDRADYLIALMRDNIDGILDEVPTVDAALARFGLAASVTRRSDVFSNLVQAAVRKDNRSLLQKINKGLAEIPLNRLAEIEARWIPDHKDRFFSKKRDGLLLNRTEKAWITKHPEISLAATPNWPPFEWRDDGNGKYHGISADFIRLAAKKAGLKVKPVFGKWGDLTDKLRAKKLDVAPGLNETTERSKYLLFTEPFVEYLSAIFTHEDADDIRHMSDLDGKTVSVEKGYALSEILPKEFPKIKLKLYESTQKALEAVSLKEVDAYIGNHIVVTYLLKKFLINNVRGNGFYNKIPGRFRFGVRNDWPILRDILNKGLAAITDEERNRILRTHIDIRLSMDKRVKLSHKERAWLAQHPKIRLGIDSAWPPFEYIDENGEYSGVASSYIDILAKRLQVNMKPRPELSWPQALEALKKRDGIDLIPAIAANAQRRKFVNFTKPYVTFPVIIVTRKNYGYVGGLKDLESKRVGVIKGYFTHDILKKNHPKIIPYPVNSVAQGLEDLKNGKMDAFIDNLSVISYEQERLGIEGLKLAAPTDYKVDLSMGVRKDWPELVSILNKALDTIDNRERAAIKNSWMAVNVQFGWDFKTVLQWALPIGASAIVLIALIGFWNRKLGSEIDERKKAQKELSFAHKELGDAMTHITDSINYASLIQRSLLPEEEIFDELFADHFILWEPRDVVGGDFYWASKWDDGYIVCLGDCTGHGVPGAFMTMITSGAMDKALLEVGEMNAGAFLNTVHRTVQRNLSQDSALGKADDGMDLAVCYINKKQGWMEYAGARFDLFIADGDEIKAIKATRRGIGYRNISPDQQYETHRIELRDGLQFYMVSDGVVDQVGGEKRRSYGKKRFRALIESIYHLPFREQHEHITKALKEYQGTEDRRDDISAIGFRF